MTLERDMIIISNGITAIIIGILVAILLYLYLKTRLSTVFLMFISLFLLFFANITQTLPMVVMSIPEIYVDAIILTSNFLFVMTAGMLILFFDQFSGLEDMSKVIFTSTTIGGMGALYLAALLRGTPDLIFEPVQVNDVTMFLFSEIFSIIFFPMAILLVYWAYTSIKDSEENAISQKQVDQIKLMKIGFGLLGIALVFGTLISPIVFSTGNFLIMLWGVFIIQRFVLSLSFAFIAYGFMSVNQVIFLQPQKLEGLLVIDETGIPLYRYDFIDIEDSETAETGLVSGAITAISALMQEAVGTRTNVKSINFFDKHLILQFKENIAAVLITSSITPFLHSSLRTFTDKFVKKFRENLEEPALHLNVFNQAENLLYEAFGFSK